MERKKRIISELEKKVYRDIQLEIFKYYDSEGMEYRGKNNPKVIEKLKTIETLDDADVSDIVEDIKDSIVDFFSYVYRLIPPLKRKVHCSKELLNKIELCELSEEHIEVLRKYTEAFAAGKDMNIFLSNNIKDTRKPDFLLYTWHLYHLHMSGKFVEGAKQMKNNRSDTQLLCIINPGDVYFVDVIPHPVKPEDYFNMQILKIIEKNGWMEKIDFYEAKDMIQGSMEPKITKNEEIFKLYSKCGFNMMFEINDKGYIPLSSMMSNRRPWEVSQEMIKIDREIQKLHHEEGIYKNFQFGCDQNGFLLGLVEFETSTGEKTLHNIF